MSNPASPTQNPDLLARCKRVREENRAAQALRRQAALEANKQVRERALAEEGYLPQAANATSEARLMIHTAMLLEPRVPDAFWARAEELTTAK